MQWTAVQEWVEQLGGVAEWLHNLWNFNVGLVPVSNTTKCKKYIVDHALFDEQLRVYSPCLANFLLWIQEVCASAQQLSDTASSLHDSVGDRGRTGGSSQKFAEADEFNSPQVLTAVVDSEEYSDEYDDDEPQGEQSAEPRPALVPVPPPGRPGAGGRPSTRDGGSRPGSQRAPRGMSGEGKEAAPPPVQATATAASEKKKAEGEGEGQSATAAAPAEAAPTDESREVEANKAQVQQHATEATSNRDTAPEKQAEAEEAPPKARDTPEDAEAAPAAEEGDATEAVPASETVSAADEAEAPGQRRHQQQRRHRQQRRLRPPRLLQQQRRQPQQPRRRTTTRKKTIMARMSLKRRILIAQRLDQYEHCSVHVSIRVDTRT